MKEDSNWQSNHLHVSIGSFGLNLILSRLDIVNDGLFNNGKFEVVALSIPLRWQPKEFIEFDGIVTNIN